MAYTARHPRCGHVKAASLDNRRMALHEFVGMGLAGLTLAREPMSQAKNDFRECGDCATPEQSGFDL